MRVINRVRMRRNIAQAKPDLAIVSVLRQRLRIIQSLRTNRAALQNELHGLFRIEFNPGLLDFLVRQEPDKRLVVKIDNLDPVPPRIVKIAAKRWVQF